MIVTNGLIIYAWVQAYILGNDNFVLMGLQWVMYIATHVAMGVHKEPPRIHGHSFTNIQLERSLDLRYPIRFLI